MKRQLSFYAAFFFLSMVFMRISGLLAKMVLARAITPFEYGLVTLVVISLPAFFQLFANFSFYDTLSHSKYGSRYFGFSIIFTLTVLIIISILFFVFRDLFFQFLNIPIGSFDVVYLSLMISAFPICILTDFMGLYRGLKRYSLPTLMSLIPSVLRLVFVFIAVYIFGITDFSAIFVIFALPSIVTFLYYIIRERSTIASYITKIEVPTKSMIAFGFSLFVVGTFISSNYSIIKIVVSHTLGVEWQGYFDVSLTLVSILTFFSATLYYITIPEATSNKSRKEILTKPGGLGDIIKTLFSYLVLCVIILHFYSVPLVELLFSESYVLAAQYTTIIAVGYLFLFVQRFLAYMNISLSESMREQKAMVLITVAFLLMLPFYTYFLITVFGFVGAYISVATLSVLYTFATYFVSRKKGDLGFLFDGIEKLAGAAIITFASLQFLALPLVYGLLLSTALFTFLIFITGYVKKQIVLDIVRSIF